MKVKDESSKFWFSRIYCTEKSTELYIQVVQRRESGETMVEKLALESFLEVTDCEFGYFFGNKFDGKGWLFSAMRRLQLLGWNVEEEDLKTLTAFRGNHDFRVHFTESYSEIFRVWRISRGEPALGESSDLNLIDERNLYSDFEKERVFPISEDGKDLRNLWREKFVEKVWELTDLHSWQEENGVSFLVGDETKIMPGIAEREGISKNWLQFVWIVINPGSKLKNLDAGFHTVELMRKGAEGDQKIVEFLGNLNEGLDGHIIIFRGEVSEEDGYSVDVLPDSVSIVLELMRSSIKTPKADNLEVHFYVEGHGGGTEMSGESSQVVQRPYREMVGSEISPRFRKSRGPDRYVGKWCLPYLAYADLVTYAAKPYNIEKIPKSNEFVKRSLNNVSVWTWGDAKILSSGLLSPATLESPELFYDELRKLPGKGNLSRWNKDLAKIVNFHSRRLAPDIPISLFRNIERDGNWGGGNYTWASDCMIEHRDGKLEKWFDELPEDAHSTKFDLCFSGLTHASRNSDSESMHEWEKKASEIIKNHTIVKTKDGRGTLEQSRIEKFNTTLEVQFHTIFKFLKASDPEPLQGIVSWREPRTFEEIVERALGTNSEPQDRSYLGARLEREFHRDGANTLGEIILIMKELRNLEWDGGKGDYSNHQIRWTGNIIHAYLDLYRGALTRGTNEGRRGDFCTHCNRERGRSLDALEYLKMALEEYEISRELEGTDHWMHSAWLKLGVFLHKEGEDVPGPIVRLIKERELPKDFGTTGNPEARVIGWGAVLSDLIGEEEYRDVLFGMYRRKAKSVLMYGGDDLYRDAMGVTFGCHLMNMEHLGFGETASRDGLAEKYLEKVVEASADETRDWYNERKPDREDPFRPLNFTYR